MPTRILIALIFLVPSVSHASVIMSEIAWMGTAVNANDEWIELHNTSDSTVSLDGWTLSDGATLTINLAGAVGAGEYVLLERTDDTTVPDVTALLTYTGALANDGRTLTLKRGDGSIEDSVAGGTDWGTIGGNNETKDTPQWTGTKWVTGTLTPGRENVSEGTLIGEDEDEVNETKNSSSQTTSSSVKTGSGGSSKKQEPAKKIPPVLSLKVSAQRTAYVNEEVPFEVIPDGVGDTFKNSLAYTWNFGDTYTGVGKKPTHMFTYPGEYTVVVEGEFAKQYALARHELTVLPVSFTLGMTETGDVTIKNSAKYEVDLGGFMLSGVNVFTFPKYTILKSGGTLTIPKARIGGGQNIALYDTQRTLVTSYGTTAEQVNRIYAKATTVSEVVPKAQEELVSEIKVGEEKVGEVPKETVIQIGTAKKEESKGIAGFFKKIVSFFGL